MRREKLVTLNEHVIFLIEIILLLTVYARTRLTLDALSRISHLPTLVEPVKDILRNKLEWHNLDPTLATLLRPTGITFKTPAGNPASRAIAHKARADSGVSSEGFMVIVHPAAIAGPIYVHTERQSHFDQFTCSFILLFVQSLLMGNSKELLMQLDPLVALW